MALYIPTYNTNNCVILVNEDIIRVYDSRPTQNSTVYYTDYYYNSNYYTNRGYSTFSQYSTLPNCRTDITTNWYHRIDLDKILLSFFIILVIVYFLGFRPIQRLLGRWLKW